MQFTHVVALLGGLALFLYGMQMMGGGLEKAAGNKMKLILEKLTSNRFLGVLVGAVITAVIQSSSATTVMVVGFVSTGMMTLNQAVWVIMGANIGTTITGQLVALDIGAGAPLIAFLGVAAVVFIKNRKIANIGQILAGFGILFIGMDMMAEAMRPLQSSQTFLDLMTQFKNPVLGIGVGAIFTALIQSSSAAIGILQTLAAQGLIPFASSVFVLFGMNIGTCITAVLASIGTSKEAKRTTVIHLTFNVIGTLLFTAVCILLPVTDWVGRFTPNAPAAQIANMHTVFNIVTTLALLPFGNYLAKLARKVLPDKRNGEQNETSLVEFAKRTGGLGYGAIHTERVRQEVAKMITLAKENVGRCFDCVITADEGMIEEIEKTEERLDEMNKDISQFISKILARTQGRGEVADTEEYFLISGNVERIGDHAVNIGGYVNRMLRHSVTFSEGAVKELKLMRETALSAMEKISKPENGEAWLSAVAALEEEMDVMKRSYRDSHIERMKKGECTEEGCILFSELLTDFERIGDHALNVAQAYAKIHA